MREGSFEEQKPSLKDAVQSHLREQEARDAARKLEEAFAAFDESRTRALQEAEGITEEEAKERVRKAGEEHYAKHYEGK